MRRFVLILFAYYYFDINTLSVARYQSVLVW